VSPDAPEKTDRVKSLAGVDMTKLGLVGPQGGKASNTMPDPVWKAWRENIMQLSRLKFSASYFRIGNYELAIAVRGNRFRYVGSLRKSFAASAA